MNDFSSTRKIKSYSALSVIITLNVIVFIPWIFGFLTGNTFPYNFITYFGSLTVNVQRAPLFFDGHFYQIVTAMFIHGSLMHLAFNMYALSIFGKLLEYKWGKLRFLLFYLVVGITANIASAFFFNAAGFPVRLIGASGAVYGVLLAFGAYKPDAVLLLFFVVPVKTKWLIPLFVIAELFLEFTQTSSGIAHMTHLFGFLSAFIYLIIFFKINPIKKMYFPSEEDKYEIY